MLLPIKGQNGSIYEAVFLRFLFILSSSTIIQSLQQKTTNFVFVLINKLHSNLHAAYHFAIQ